ncbi:MAG: hypothetical protein HGA75_09480 [Thiobacillus sp.]|nr:hypothetical protein [Thiobacillus sp.]
MTQGHAESTAGLASGPWQVTSLPPGWDWIPGYGLYQSGDAAARLNLVFTWDELGEVPDLNAYVARQRQGLAGMVSSILPLGTENLNPGGYDEVQLIRLVLDHGGAQEVWQEQLYLRLDKTIGIVTASGPAAQAAHLREALRLALKLAVFSKER